MPEVLSDLGRAPSALYALVTAALVVAFVSTPLAMRLATRLGVIDRPGGRHQHERAVPLLGGIGIVAGILVAVAWNLDVVDRRFASILLGAVLICLLGAVDDAVSLPAPVKLVGQAACAILPISQGVSIDGVTLPIILNRGIDLGVLAYPITIVFIVAVANIVNFADGMDGLAAGICAIASGTFVVLALSLDRIASATLAAAICGACIGFLRWNFHPARVFMGDSGSLPLGFLLACVSIQGVMKTAAALSLVFPLLVLLVPILDTSFVIAKRLKYGQPIAGADRNHFHHRMLRMGWSQRRAALLLYAWCLVLAAFAIAARYLRYRTGDDWNEWSTAALTAFALVALGVSVYVVYALEILKYRHVRVIGIARHSPEADDASLAEVRRRRRERAAS